MTTKSVRVREQDFDLVNELSGMDAAVPFAVKLQMVLDRLGGRHLLGEMDALRLVMREELERFAGGEN